MTTTNEDDGREQKGRLWLFMVSAYNCHLKIERMRHVYAATREEAERLTAAWRATKEKEGYPKHTMTCYPAGFTVGSARTLPGSIEMPYRMLCNGT